MQSYVPGIMKRASKPLAPLLSNSGNSNARLSRRPHHCCKQDCTALGARIALGAAFVLVANMQRVKARAASILAQFEQSRAELIGKAVVLTDGKAGTVDQIWLDELHGLRLAIRGHEGRWPVSTIKLAQT